MRMLPVLLCAFFAIAVSAMPGRAHFSEGVKVRSIVLTREAEGTTAYVRVPVPMLFGDLIEEARDSGTPLDSAFVYSRDGATGPVFRLSRDAIAADPAGFAARLQGALGWSQNGKPVDATLTGHVLHAYSPDTAFDSSDTARAALGAEASAGDPLFGEAVIDMALMLDAAVPRGALQVVSAYPPVPLLEGVAIDNHIVDARGGTPLAYTVAGQLETPATIDGSRWRIAGEFVKQGILHIVEGIDHVLLVVCLALGIGTRMRLLWIVTAFTLGHSVTLVATFLGATPQWPWFIPAVETAIAATVLYAAAAAFLKKMDSIAVIAAVGLLHGLGFSFVLSEILGPEAPGLVTALLSFNAGIEIGQLAIIAATLAVATAATRLSASAAPVLRNAVLAAIGAVSAWWVIERGTALLA